MAASGACAKCGTALRPGAAFCAGCGAEVPRTGNPLAAGTTGTVIAPTPDFAATAPPPPVAPAPSAPPTSPASPAPPAAPAVPTPMDPIVARTAPAGTAPFGASPVAGQSSTLPRMHWSAFAVIAALAVTIAGAILTAVGAAMCRSLIGEIADTSPTALLSALADLKQRADQADSLFSAGTSIVAIGLIASGVLFIVWLYIAYGKVGANGFTADVLRRPRHQIIWAWFVPIFGLFRPVQIVADCYRTSQGPLADPAETWTARPLTPLIGIWWAAALVTGIILRITSTIESSLADSTSWNEMADDYAAEIALYLLATIGLALTILLVLKIARTPVQRQR